MTSLSHHGKVLVVDDDALIREGFAAVLTHEGFAVDMAADGLAALERLQSDGFDLLVTDLRMPRLDGYGLIARVRQTDPDLPVIAITGDMPSREMRALVERPGQRVMVLIKPVHFNRFLDGVRQMMAEPPDAESAPRAAPPGRRNPCPAESRG